MALVLNSIFIYFFLIGYLLRGFGFFQSTNDVIFGICQIIEIIYFEKFMPMKDNWYFVLINHFLFLKNIHKKKFNFKTHINF